MSVEPLPSPGYRLIDKCTTMGDNMKAPLRELEAAVMALPESERARLAERILSSLDRDPEIEAAWAKEIEDRLERYRRGELETVPAEEVMKEARGRIQS